MTRPARTANALRTAAVTLLATTLAVLPAAPAQADGIRAAQWALEAVHAQTAWRTTKGEGITVAVLDTGVDATNPDLKGRVLPGKDLVGFGASRGDRAWARHGTGMAGIIAGQGHGPGRGDGVLGIAPDVRILPVRVILEDADPDRKRARAEKSGALADGIRWAADHGADVINLSLGDDSASAHPEPREDTAIQYALGKGVSVVASAGNGGLQGNRASYPAAYPGVIAVTAVDNLGTRAPFSTRHWYATVCAPGDDIVMPDPDRKYYRGQGTSPAAAFVSGTIALVRAAHPDLSPAQIRQLLIDTAQDGPKSGRDDDYGAGMVDAAAALGAAAKTKPAAQKPAPARYAERYFGSGPTPAPEAESSLGALPWVAGGTGLALLVAAVVIRATRPRHH